MLQGHINHATIHDLQWGINKHLFQIHHQDIDCYSVARSLKITVSYTTVNRKENAELGIADSPNGSLES